MALIMTTPTCRACGKNLYPNQTAAFAVILKVSRKRGGAFRAYPCYAGSSGWHITKKTRGGKRNA